jgi:hypothetical protein
LYFSKSKEFYDLQASLKDSANAFSCSLNVYFEFIQNSLFGSLSTKAARAAAAIDLILISTLWAWHFSRQKCFFFFQNGFMQ